VPKQHRVNWKKIHIFYSKKMVKRRTLPATVLFSHFTISKHKVKLPAAYYFSHFKGKHFQILLEFIPGHSMTNLNTIHIRIVYGTKVIETSRGRIIQNQKGP
jgi:hypothetical protein